MDGRTWNMWAHRFTDGVHWNINEDRSAAGRRGLAHPMQEDQPVVRVFVTEWTGDPKATEVTHYAWERLGETRPTGLFSITPRTRWPNVSPTMLFEMSAASEVMLGNGRMVALVIVERADDE